MRAAPPLIMEERGRGAVFVWLALAAALAGVTLLYFFNPVETPFYPRCFFKMATGFDCPGCGGLRATHQLLHGHWRAAFDLNPLFIVALPTVMFFLVRAAVEKWNGRKWPRVFQTATLIWGVVSLVVAFGILRNLPWRAWLGV